MDNRSSHPNQSSDTGKSNGCCGNAHQAKPVSEQENRPADANKPEKAGKSGCCCGGD